MGSALEADRGSNGSPIYTYDWYEYLEEKRAAFAALADWIDRIVSITAND